MKEKYAIGIDLGGTKIKFGIVSSAGKILKKSSIPTLAEEGVDISIGQIKKGVASLLKANKNKYKIGGIGIGAPGVVALKKGTVENPPNLPGWKKVPLGKIINKEFSFPVYVENDANAAAIGEFTYGAGKKLDSFIMITLGTGVGGGIILDKQLLRGETGAAGEIGHTSVDFNGPACKCGSFGCLEAYLGNNYLIENVKKELLNAKDSKIYDIIENDLNKLTPKVIYEASQIGDEFSINVIKNAGDILGYGLASMVNLLDICSIIIGGGVAGFGKLLFDSVQESIQLRVLKSLKSRVNVIPASLKNDAGIKGAASLIFYT